MRRSKSRRAPSPLTDSFDEIAGATRRYRDNIEEGLRKRDALLVEAMAEVNTGLGVTLGYLAFAACTVVAAAVVALTW